MGDLVYTGRQPYVFNTQDGGWFGVVRQQRMKRCWPCHKPQVAGANGVTASSSVAQDAWATMSWIKKWYKYRLARNWNKSYLQFFIRPIGVNYVAPSIGKAMT